MVSNRLKSILIPNFKAKGIKSSIPRLPGRVASDIEIAASKVTKTPEAYERNLAARKVLLEKAQRQKNKALEIQRSKALEIQKNKELEAKRVQETPKIEAPKSYINPKRQVQTTALNKQRLTGKEYLNPATDRYKNYKQGLINSSLPKYSSVQDWRKSREASLNRYGAFSSKDSSLFEFASANNVIKKRGQKYTV